MSILKCFMGQHHTMLNNILRKYQTAGLDNLLKFLNSTWMSGLIHDRFNSMQLENREVMLEIISPYLGGSEDFRNKLKIFRLLNQSGCGKILESNLLEFIHRNRDELPMYALPEGADFDSEFE